MLEQLLPPDDHHHLLFLLRLIEKIQRKLWMIAGVPHLIEIRQTVLNTCMGWIFGKWVFYVTISFLYIIYVYCIYVRTQVHNVPSCPSHCGADIQPRLGRYKMQQIPLVLSELNVFILARPLADIQSLLSHPHIALSVQYHSIMIKKGYKDRRKDRYNDRHKYRHKDRNKDTKTDH